MGSGITLEPWYKVVTARQEVREGRSFNPDEFAIHLEQVVAGTAPEDYKDPCKFFDRTVFTRALLDHSGMVMRRLSGKTENTSPVMTLITQFGGGKTHTLTTLYHLSRNGSALSGREEVKDLLAKAGISILPNPKVGVFVGNAWDPQPGRETPWLDLAWQLAGQKGIEALGANAKTTAPGTEALGRVFDAAGGSVLILFDEVLNYLNRYRDMADAFYAFTQNLTVAMTGTTHSAAVISLPRSQVEMSDFDVLWQEKIAKVTRRVSKDLLVNDEAEISEVIRRRLFETLGPENIRKDAALAYANWCFERRAQLPSEWTIVDSAATEAKAREFLRSRFEACYPFHPATISVFHRKWQALSQYQQTRGTLAMFAQWISWAAQTDFKRARTEPLITIGSAPLDVPEFRSVVLGQLGEARLNAAIDADIAGEHCRARAMDADTIGPLRDVHRRVATAILFESSGGMTDKVAHLPELRFALGGPDIDTTSIDNATISLYNKCFFLRKAASDGYRFGPTPTLKKVVSDRKAGLDESEVTKAVKDAVKREFEQGASVPLARFPQESAEVSDSPKLTVVVVDPSQAWENGQTRARIAEWTYKRNETQRLYPAALVWCIKKPGRELHDRVEEMLAWKRVQDEVSKGILGGEFDKEEIAGIKASVHAAEDDVKDEVWASYRYVALADNGESEGLRVIDLGAGHASSGESLCGRVITTLKSNALLNESVGAGYIERNWPPAFKESGSWPLSSLRQSFLNGSMTRLLDPDGVLKNKIPEFVETGEFGLASGPDGANGYKRIWFKELVSGDEIAFDSGVFLLSKDAAVASLGNGSAKSDAPTADPEPQPIGDAPTGPTPAPAQPSPAPPVVEEPGALRRLAVRGSIPLEIWNRLGTKLIPKLKTTCSSLRVEIEFTGSTNAADGTAVQSQIKQVLTDLGVSGEFSINLGDEEVLP